jgi:hypothetical protein
MSERSMKFHVCPLDGEGAKLPLMRHTPADRLKMYLYSPVENEIAARVLSDSVPRRKTEIRPITNA